HARVGGGEEHLVEDAGAPQRHQHRHAALAREVADTLLAPETLVRPAQRLDIRYRLHDLRQTRVAAPHQLVRPALARDDDHLNARRAEELVAERQPPEERVDDDAWLAL